LADWNRPSWIFGQAAGSFQEKKFTMMMRRNIQAAVLSLFVLAGATGAHAEDFAIRDGDTVVFLGDSITAARAYGKLIENYTLLRFPERKVHFINAGRGGETVAGGFKRFAQDVLSHKPTLVTVAYGVNDIGWGTRADDEHKQAYLEGIRGIVEACRKQGVRVYICSAAATAEDPAKSETGYLKRMCDDGMALSRSLGGNAIDVQGAMREIQKRMVAANAKADAKQEKATLHVGDGVHLNDVGQLAMALAILKGLGAPADVSTVSIDAREPKLLAAEGCTVKDLVKKDEAIEFVRLDRGLPLNNGIFFQLQFRFVPVPEELNRYMLTIANLPADRYEILADGRSAGNFSSQELAKGVNISSTTSDGWEPGGPWNAQANVLQALTESRSQLGGACATADFYLKAGGATSLLDKEAEKTNAQIEEMQRIVAKPKPYHFVIKRYVAPLGKK
jgi:lysophospholipase L1-like esterase